jgi:hypothetical protein
MDWFWRKESPKQPPKDAGKDPKKDSRNLLPPVNFTDTKVVDVKKKAQAPAPAKDSRDLLPTVDFVQAKPTPKEVKKEELDRVAASLGKDIKNILDKAA